MSMPDERVRTSFSLSQAALHYYALEVLEQDLEAWAARTKEAYTIKGTKTYINANVKLMEVQLQKQVLDIECTSVWGSSWRKIA